MNWFRAISGALPQVGAGLLWTVLNPLLMMCVITVVFFRFSSRISEFPIYYLSGSLIFSFNSEATTNAMHSILSNCSLIKRSICPNTCSRFCVLSSLVNLGFCSSRVYRDDRHAHAFPCDAALMPIPIFYTFLFSVGLGTMLAALTVYFRDIAHFYGVFILAWTYFTPIFYPVDILPDFALRLMQFNPMFHYVNFMRELVIYGTFPGITENLICVAMSVLMLFAGFWVFYKKQDHFVLYI
ncbi:MAG: ABC transporter permease [Christensenellales bacterium]